MNRQSILAIGAALLLLVGAMPTVAAAAPADVPTDSQTDDTRSVGPSGGLPGPVPDFMSGIHDTISSFRNGDIADLGEALKNTLADEGPADTAAGVESL